MATHTLLSRTAMTLSDNIALARDSEVFAASGNTAGVDRFTLHEDGTLEKTVQFVLGINRFERTSGIPRNDEIRRVVSVPARERVYRTFVNDGTAFFEDCWRMTEDTLLADRALLPDGTLAVFGDTPLQYFAARLSEGDFALVFFGLLVSGEPDWLYARGVSTNGDVIQSRGRRKRP